MQGAIKVSGTPQLNALRDDRTGAAAWIVGLGQVLSPAMASARFLSVKLINPQVPET
jgi:hypothetical protein